MHLLTIIEAVALCLLVGLEAVASAMSPVSVVNKHIILVMAPHLLYTIIGTLSLGNLLPFGIMAALHELVSSFCSFSLRLLTVWWTTPEELLIWSLGLCLIVGVLCHGEAADVRQVAQNVTDEGLHGHYSFVTAACWGLASKDIRYTSSA